MRDFTISETMIVYLLASLAIAYLADDVDQVLKLAKVIDGLEDQAVEIMEDAMDKLESILADALDGIKERHGIVEGIMQHENVS
mgnify:CR=1 FL=1